MTLNIIEDTCPVEYYFFFKKKEKKKNKGAYCHIFISTIWTRKLYFTVVGFRCMTANLTWLILIRPSGLLTKKTKKNQGRLFKLNLILSNENLIHGHWLIFDDAI
jgi:hypothetical protein